MNKALVKRATQKRATQLWAHPWAAQVRLHVSVRKTVCVLRCTRTALLHYGVQLANAVWTGRLVVAVVFGIGPRHSGRL
jgi:hypothetical protein